MDIDREVCQGLSTAMKRVKFCLDKLEQEGFKNGVDWHTRITHRLTVEEIVGALVSAEQELKAHDFIRLSGKYFSEK